MKGIVGELFHFSGFRTVALLLPLGTSLLGLGQYRDLCALTSRRRDEEARKVFASQYVV
jgi:hypothetical protein